MSVRILVCSAIVAAGFGASAAAQAPSHEHYQRADAAAPGPGGALAPRLQNLGSHTFKVTTKSVRAQQFINQGLNLAYGFNHAEAGRAFAEAARLDPSCAMAYWGQALVLGPNINAAMAPDDEPKAFELVQKASAAKTRVTPRERAYIEALSARYTGKADDRQQADRAYAEEMRALQRTLPGDLDAATLFAESLMDLRPWNYWTRDGLPNDGTQEAIAALQRVLAANPKHPGALHYWIHLWEPTKTPERAEKEADRLLPLMPGAGHIVHMPAHIYLRVGRYVDAVKANQQAVAADEDYIAQCRVQGMYPLGYYPHNIHFIWMGATMSGQSALAHRVGAEGGGGDSRRSADRQSAAPGLSRRALLRARAVREVGRDSGRAGPGLRYDLHARCVALRARPRLDGQGPARGGRQGARGARGDRHGPGAAIAAGVGFAQHAGRNPADRAGSAGGRNRARSEGRRQGACCTSNGRSGSRTRLVYTEPPDWP